MSDEYKIPYLKIDRGRYFYQRRVPQKMQAHLGLRRWQLPCGDVSYSDTAVPKTGTSNQHGLSFCIVGLNWLVIS
jgi:hypothetical protein